MRSDLSLSAPHSYAVRGFQTGEGPAEPPKRLRLKGRRPTPTPYDADGKSVGPTVRGDHKKTRYALMILPQVHLRKPCYDFYFL